MVESKSTRSFGRDSKIHECGIAMACPKHIECHEEKVSYHVKSRITKHTLKGKCLALGEERGRVL